MLQVTPIPAFQDNYFWAIHNQHECVVVDPGLAGPVQDFLDRHQLQLAAILITHHHADHTGGLPELAGKHLAPVYGPDNPAIAGISHVVRDSDSVTLLDTEFIVMAVPGHTLDHLAFHASAIAALFCGDTLFAAGCGRLFEGSPAMMFASLEKLAALPAHTRVFCAHEYTLANLRFALAVEPENSAIRHRLQHCESLRAQNTCTLPALLQEELQTNPFLRTRENAVINQALSHGAASAAPVDVFAGLREWKNRF